MSETPALFDWTIDPAGTWPPRRRPRPPFGPAVIELIRSCPLRSAFEASSGYERRRGYAARVGTAFHRVIESFSVQPPLAETTQGIAEEARRRFAAALQEQLAEAARRPRERGLPRDQERAQRAVEAAVVEALRLADEHTGSGGGRLVRTTGWPDADSEAAAEPIPWSDAAGTVETEIPVRSRDGLLHGRIDRAEHQLIGTRLVDFKSALRDDLPERYERQLQLYALMWHDTRGDWPVEAEVVYPLAGSRYPVAIPPELCEQVANEAAVVVGRLRNNSAWDLATPGDVCKVCEFRPWCAPFWRWQADERSHAVALERATMGVEGDILAIEILNHHWKLQVQWRGCTVHLIAPLERLPQLHQATTGMRVRVLDMPLRGQRYQPRATMTDSSELFLVQRTSPQAPQPPETSQ